MKQTDETDKLLAVHNRSKQVRSKNSHSQSPFELAMYIISLTVGTPNLLESQKISKTKQNSKAYSH